MFDAEPCHFARECKFRLTEGCTERFIPIQYLQLLGATATVEVKMCRQYFDEVQALSNIDSEVGEVPE